ncbi:hypothetical protein chiPu_0024051, partial [Chiloscyllium punctatum]|nr:hypothetical protein [Chiloscyllium punctatum]
MTRVTEGGDGKKKKNKNGGARLRFSHRLSG